MPPKTRSPQVGSTAEDIDSDNTTSPQDALAELKAMVMAQQLQLQLLQDHNSATAATATPAAMRSTESEAKDLLRKVSFDGKNFSAFKTKFQNICQLRHIWGVIDGTDAAPESDAPMAAVQVHADKVILAKSYLQTCLSNDIFDMVSDDETPAEMWCTLVANYETKSWSNTIYAMRRLSTVKYVAGTDMLRHINFVKTAVRELNDMGKTINEAETVEWILISLPDDGPDNFNSFINTLKPTPDHEVRMKTLTSALLNEEEKRRERKRTTRTRFDVGPSSHPQDKRKRDMDEDVRHAINALESRVASLASKRSKADKWCYICKKRGDHEATGHPGYDPNFVRQRPSGTSSGRARRDQPTRHTNAYGDSEDGAVLYRANAIASVAQRAPCSDATDTDKHWTLDNCATGHVTGNSDWITAWKGTSHLVLPDKSSLQGRRGTAKIDLYTADEHHVLKLHNVTFQGSIYKNLISHIQLLHSGYELTHQDMATTAYVHKHHGRRLNFVMCDGMYVLDQGHPLCGMRNDTVNAAKVDDMATTQDPWAVALQDDPHLTMALRRERPYGARDAPRDWLLSTSPTGQAGADCSTADQRGDDDTTGDAAANAVVVSGDEKAQGRRGPDAATDDKLLEWHHRLNHANMDQVAKIIRPLLVPGEDRATTTAVCDGCAQGQAKRISYRNTHHYVPAEPLEILSADLCGPVKPPTIHKEHFTSMFIDQASRYVFGKLIKTKDDAILHLDDITSTLDSRLPGARVRMLHTDGGGEYTGHAFRAACSARGIVQKFTNADTPEENHLAEKTNEYVFNKIRTYLTMTGLPKSLWGYCFDYVVYVYNHIPQELLNNRTPYEVLFGKPSRLHMLKTFGCLAYKFVPKSQRPSKLSNSAVPCVFLGYADGQLGYKLWNPKDRTITVSRSVTFDETKIRNSHLFASTDFGDGRLVIPASIGGVATDDDLAQARFGAAIKSTGSTPRINTAKRPADDTTANTHRAPSTRARKKPAQVTVNQVHVGSDLGHTAVVEPTTMADLQANPHKVLWLAAMQEEIDALKANGVWKLVDLPRNRKPLKSKWVWKVKYLPCGKIERLKARLVIKGFMQIAGVDFTDTFAPVVRLDSLRVLCALIALYDLETVQIDVQTAFLNGELDELIFMAQPAGFVDAGFPDKVCQLLKALYGLKQAPRQWLHMLHDFLTTLGFRRCYKDQCIYVRTSMDPADTMYLAVYVDDITIAGRSKTALHDVKTAIEARFATTDKGELDFLLGIKITRNRARGTLHMHQGLFVAGLLERFNMAACHPVPTPQVTGTPTPDDQAADARSVPYQNLVGALQYLVSATRPDIANAVRYLASHTHDHTQTHWRLAKRVLKYIAGTPELGLCYSRSGSTEPLAYSDADFANDSVDSKSITGSVILLAGAAVVYSSRKQSLVGQSTTEVEYIAAAETAKSIIWLRELLGEMRHPLDGPTRLMVDNQSAITVAARTSAHGRTKHIRLRYHFLQDEVAAGTLRLEYVNTKAQVADILTKALVDKQYGELRAGLGLV